MSGSPITSRDSRTRHSHRDPCCRSFRSCALRALGRGGDGCKLRGSEANPRGPWAKGQEPPQRSLSGNRQHGCTSPNGGSLQSLHHCSQPAHCAQTEVRRAVAVRVFHPRAPEHLPRQILVCGHGSGSEADERVPTLTYASAATRALLTCSLQSEVEGGVFLEDPSPSVDRDWRVRRRPAMAGIFAQGFSPASSSPQAYR